MSEHAIRIATRASALALWQANHTADLLRRVEPGRAVELVRVSTEGDRDQTSPLVEAGGVGVFTREVQRAVLENRADVAVHSLKDLPTEEVEGLTCAGVPARAVVFDALVLPSSADSETSRIEALPEGARIGTGSPRRRAQLLHLRPDLQISDVRGNVDTRLKKLDEGGYDALILAAAGLTRLGLKHRISATLRPPQMYPAVGQGALGIECRTDNGEVVQALEQITDRNAMAAVRAERRLLSDLRAGCHAPVGVFTTIEEDVLTLDAVVLSIDGTERITAKHSESIETPERVGEKVAAELISLGADVLVRQRDDC